MRLNYNFFSHSTDVVLTKLRPGHRYEIEIQEFRGDSRYDGYLDHGTKYEIRTC